MTQPEPIKRTWTGLTIIHEGKTVHVFQDRELKLKEVRQIIKRVVKS